MDIPIEISDQDLPVLSAVASEALTLLNDPNVTIEKIEQLVRQDPALASRLLHIANSPFYATRMESRSIADAARKLGMRQLKNIIVAAAAGELFPDDDAIAHMMWEHAQAVALAAQLIAKALDVTHAEEAYIAGLLHDIGKITIYRQHPQLYASVLGRAEEEGRPIHEIENEVFKYFTHMSVGGLVIRKWRLSDTISEAARYHHDVYEDIPAVLNCAPVVCVVALANEIADRVRLEPESVPDAASFMDAEYIAYLRISRGKLAKIMTEVCGRLSECMRAA